MSAAPPGWASLALAEVVSLKTGPFGSALHKSDYVVGGIPLINPSHIRNGRLEPDPGVSVDESAKARLNEYSLQAGDVVMGRRGEMGRCAVIPTEASGWLCGTGSVIVRPSPAIRAPFLQRFLSSPAIVESLNGDSVGSTMVNLNQGVLLGLPIELPPLAEQQRIAEKLDTVLARVDACRDRLARVAPLLKRFRQSVLAAATSGRLTEDWRGSAASAWARMRAEDACAKVQSGGTPKAGFTETSGVPFLKVYNIVNQQIDFEYRPQFVNPAVHAGELGKSRALPGDVLMNIVGPPLGKVAVLTDAAPEWNINQAITLFRPSARITTGWLYVLLCEGAAVRSVLDRTKGSVGQVNISLSQCRAFEFPVPPIDEQNEIVRRVETLFAFTDRLEARLAQAQTAVNRLTPSLLAKAFRGELVPQDPADEPAAELLQRLAASRTAPATKTRKPSQGQAA